MILNGFSFEVLVDEMPLVEYAMSDSVANITTGKSYALQGNIHQQPIFSDLNNYIIAEPGKKFKLKFFSTKASSKTPMMAETLIDGQFDKTYRGLKSRTVQFQDSFFNATRDKKLEFIFSNSIYDESSSTPNNTFNSRGGIGAISIYFYKGRSVIRQNVNIPSFDIQQAKVKESKKTFGIQCTTDFVPRNVRNHICYYDMVKESNDPIAVLHLHYRPASWFAMRGIQVQNQPSFPNFSFSSGVIGNQINNLPQSNNNDGINPNNTIKNEIKNENDHNNKVKKENNRNNKRPLDEINGIKTEIEVIDLTNDDAESSGTVEKRARVIDWLSKI
ncbi:hypothetical protein RclHR1_09850010 [Rhizophagus clarus]|uniref:Glycoside hydrolase family 20 protein n=1 Tax=Rhizophagus clarus TaxID=94130 RepID=A0A2Z6S7R5_9GLOM|nr:hypothetical protein RclHR1_09850010 [Rhizophagus clarus]GES80755.1 glycoside hydrolase family 20 protein [Rhizophagus clarus]